MSKKWMVLWMVLLAAACGGPEFAPGPKNANDKNSSKVDEPSDEVITDCVSDDVCAEEGQRCETPDQRCECAKYFAEPQWNCFSADCPFDPTHGEACDTLV